MKFLNQPRIKRKLSIQKQRRKLKRVGNVLTPVLIIATVVLGLYALFIKFEYFNISNAYVEGAKSFVSNLDMLELVKSRAYGQNILFFNTQNLADSLKKDFQGAKTIQVIKKYPKTLVIKVTERIPLAVVHNQNSPDYFLVDDDGYVLGMVDPNTSNFPQIFYEGNIAVGYFLDREAIGMYFDVITATDDAQITVKSASVYDKYLKMIIDDNVEVFISKDKNIKNSVNVLSSLLKQLKTQSKSVGKVDLRYDKVIVSYR